MTPRLLKDAVNYLFIAQNSRLVRHRTQISQFCPKSARHPSSSSLLLHFRGVNGDRKQTSTSCGKTRRPDYYRILVLWSTDPVEAHTDSRCGVIKAAVVDSGSLPLLPLTSLPTNKYETHPVKRFRTLSVVSPHSAFKELVHVTDKLFK